MTIDYTYSVLSRRCLLMNGRINRRVGNSLCLLLGSDWKNTQNVPVQENKYVQLNPHNRIFTFCLLDHCQKRFSKTIFRMLLVIVHGADQVVNLFSLIGFTHDSLTSPGIQVYLLFIYSSDTTCEIIPQTKCYEITYFAE